VDVAAAVIFRRGRLLLAQRRPGKHLEGLWEFPGGKREPGESFPEALRRELREELDVQVRVGRLIAETIHAYPDRQVRLRFYRCRVESGIPQPIGCAALAWVARPELAAYRFPDADAPLVERLRRSPRLWIGTAPQPQTS
jgi:mutator protein MutT